MFDSLVANCERFEFEKLLTQYFQLLSYLPLSCEVGSMDLRIPIADEAGSIVKARFQEFLQTFQLVTEDEMDMTTQQK